MSEETVVIRCDGGAAIGAGHVARTLPIADALVRRGVTVRFAGTFDGVAAELLAGHEIVAPADRPAGIPPDADAAIVDSYDIGPEELEQANAARPVLTISDDDTRPAVALVLAYHLDGKTGPNVLAGPDYAPIHPRAVAARRATRDSGRALVVIGGGTTGADVVAPAVEALLAETDCDVDVAGATEPPQHERVHTLGAVSALAARFGDYELAVCGAGVTKYEAACAGLPAVLVVVADNQLPGARSFERLDLAHVVDGRRPPVSAEVIRRTIAATDRAAAAERGPRVVDGLGSMRVADALLARLRGTDPPPIQRLTPEAADPDRLYAERDGDPVAAVTVRREGATAYLTLEARVAEAGEQALRDARELVLAAHPEIRRVELAQ